jgi:hypothetical protein
MRDAVELSAESFSGMFSSDLPATQTRLVLDLTDADFRTPGRNISDIEVRDVSFARTAGTHVTVSFSLSSRASGTDYPTLRVVLFSASDAVLRNVDFPPGSYQHADSLSRERITLDVEPRPGETRLNVQAYYEDATAPRP